MGAQFWHLRGAKTGATFLLRPDHTYAESHGCRQEGWLKLLHCNFIRLCRHETIAAIRFLQVLVNAEPRSLDMDLEECASNYAFSKIQAKKIVRDADSKEDGFKTGCIRPGHAIYGRGIESPSSIAYDYLRRGGAPSWLGHIVTNFVDAQNVAIAHLLFESHLVQPTGSANTLDLGGRAYCVTDPSPPCTYGNLYLLLATLAHLATPARFPVAHPLPFLLLAHAIETYTLLRHRYLSFLTPVTGDLAEMQPTLFNMCTLHQVYDNSLAQQELGYRAPIETLKGLYSQVLEWNEKQERKLAAGGETKDKAPDSAIPIVPATVA